jgi:hypothetical protein
MKEISYTHAVFRKGKYGLVKFALFNVSYAILQVRELCSTEENITSLLWILEFLRKPQKGYFLSEDPKIEAIRESLIEYKILIPTNNGDYTLESVFLVVLQAMSIQNNLAAKAIKVAANIKEPVTPTLDSIEEGDESIGKSDRFDRLAESLTLELDFWDESTNRYSNPNLIPKVKGKSSAAGFADGFTLGKINDDFLKGL